MVDALSQVLTRDPGADAATTVPTVGSLPCEDIVVVAPGTLWRVPWELMMLGPFVSCGLLDGPHIRHVTVPALVTSATRRGTAPSAPLVAEDYVPLPVFAADTPLLDAAALVAGTAWDLAVVMDREPRVITARSVYRALVGSARLAPAGAAAPRTAGASR